MRLRLVVTLWLVFPLLSAWAQDVEQRFEKTFPGDVESVSLHVTRGVIEIANAPKGDDTRISVWLRLQSKNRDEKTGLFERLTPDLLAPLKRDIDGAFKSLSPRFRTTDKRVEMTLRDSRPIVFDSDPTLQVIIVVRVALPIGAKLDVRTVAAGITSEDFQGSIDIRGETGSCFFKSVSGDFSVRTNSGSITVGEIGGRTNLRTTSGGILTGRLRGPAKLVTANGAIEVQQAYDALVIEGDDADILVGVSSPMPEGMNLRTSAGTITLTIDRDVPLTIDAATRLLGKVRSRGLEPVVRRGSFNGSSLLADFNGGGPLVKLRTSWGNVFLIGREPLDG